MVARMARAYRLGTARRLLNRTIGPLTRFGLAGRHMYLMTVRGRTTGKAYTLPVRLIEEDGRWLVAPYGEVAWVRNARAAGEVQLSRSGHSETLHIEEVAADVAAPVLKRYLDVVPVVRPFFDVTRESSLTDITAEAPRHPVFRLTAT
jgi:deazaflavin-dependent oxidoreductase (nitroreductase family)